MRKTEIQSQRSVTVTSKAFASDSEDAAYSGFSDQCIALLATLANLHQTLHLVFLFPFTHLTVFITFEDKIHCRAPSESSLRLL